MDELEKFKRLIQELSQLVWRLKVIREGHGGIEENIDRIKVQE